MLPTTYLTCKGNITMKLMKCKNYESKNTGGSRQYSYNVNPRQNKTRCGPERKKVCNKGSRNVTLIVIDISFGREQRHLDLDLETRTADTVATLRTGHWALTSRGCGVIDNSVAIAIMCRQFKKYMQNKAHPNDIVTVL